MFGPEDCQTPEFCYYRNPDLHTATSNSWATVYFIADMRLVVDFIPGTTSKQHMWFTESARSSDQDNDYRNYYVWKDGTQEPTNWVSVWKENLFPTWVKVYISENIIRLEAVLCGFIW